MTTFFLIATSQAAKPVWTFEPLTLTSIPVPADGTAIVQYRITNQSKKKHTLKMTPIRGIDQISSGTVPDNCANVFVLGYQESCVLTLLINGSALQGNVSGGPSVCQQTYRLECYQPSSINSLNIQLTEGSRLANLVASVSTLALRINGIARIITITNNGTVTASGVTYAPSPALPAGTTITPASCGTIIPGGSCILTITPGGTPNATPGDLNPTPVTLTIAGNNTNTIMPTLNILAYGSVYQSGYVFSFNDATPPNGSVGGKIAALVDQATFLINGVYWSADNTNNPVFDFVPGVYENSVNPPDVCTGNSDGACNTNVIVNYYSPPTTNPAVELSFYGAGLCRQLTAGGYTDWYLPAICEMGYDRANQGTGCGTQVTPTLQNMQSNLVANGNIGALSGPYWSSTESSINVPTNAWDQFFSAVPNVNFQDEDSKAGPISIRCVRAITN